LRRKRWAVYINLKAQMAIHNISIEKIAEVLKIHRNTVANKLNRGVFSIDEAFCIKKNLFREYDIYYLFNRNNKNQSA